jgi:glycosyltransferase involved in cell wall biosynthesis
LQLHITAAGREAKTKKRQLDFWTRFWEWPLHKFSDWLGVRVADKVICVSSHVKEEAQKFYGADPEKLEVVENGVNTGLFAPQKKSQIKNPKFQILYIGALQPRKNVHLLIDALSNLPEEYQLTIVGKGDEEYEKSLHTLVAKKNLESRISFKGYIEYPKLPPVYQKADIFVLPSSYEGLPKVVLEALACGVPVLASGFDIERNFQGIDFLEDLTPESVAENIEKSFASRLVVDTNFIQQNYSWEQKAKEIEKIYKTI